MSKDLQEYKLQQGAAALMDAYILLNDKVRNTLNETGNSTVTIDHILSLLAEYSNLYERTY